MSYGWYSQKQAETYGRSSFNVKPRGPSIYLTPSGKKVTVTEVTNDKTPFGNWDDYVYVGEVTDYLGHAEIQKKVKGK